MLSSILPTIPPVLLSAVTSLLLLQFIIDTPPTFAVILPTIPPAAIYSQFTVPSLVHSFILQTDPSLIVPTIPPDEYWLASGTETVPLFIHSFILVLSALSLTCPTTPPAPPVVLVTLTLLLQLVTLYWLESLITAIIPALTPLAFIVPCTFKLLTLPFFFYLPGKQMTRV